jgi:quercetin dioxygenase-like cupin family protein
MTFGTTGGQRWSETLPTGRGAGFAGRTFCRFHITGGVGTEPAVAEIWATPDHAVEGHAHDADELLYVLSGAIEVNGRPVRANEVVFIPRGDHYHARVLSDEGCHVLRVAFPNPDAQPEPPEYGSRPWSGPVTGGGFPDLVAESAAGSGGRPRGA